MWRLGVLLFILVSKTFGQSQLSEQNGYRCPKYWIKFQESCYKFVKSPLKNHDGARQSCQTYQSDLASLDSVEEHGFLMYQLLWQDPHHRSWWIGVRQQGGYWSNEVDGTQLPNMETAFLPEPNDDIMRDYLAYGFSNGLKRWGLNRTTPDEHFLYICEASILAVQSLIDDERDFEYGLEVVNPREIPRGPYFIKQPEDKIFDVSRRLNLNVISLSCLADGYPSPTYDWYKEEYKDGLMNATLIDPFADSRYTISGGNMIIQNPQEHIDHGKYFCVASNKYGRIVSESVELNFAFILEFHFGRTAESGDLRWGKALYCDPPQHYPSVKFYWLRNKFPDFVLENERVFVSHDGTLYFTSLDYNDEANYTCIVQSVASATGKTGPSFPLRVNNRPSFQILKFANNFPKVFPIAPNAGQEVRMECIAYGFPVPYYNWTRRGAPLPRGSEVSNFGHVLTIPQVRIEDQGEYICRAYNDRVSVENSVWLSIQAEPNFTIPLENKHMDYRGEVTWTCEAFGVPDVQYAWLKNGVLLNKYALPTEYVDRYFIQDNVLKIVNLDPKMDAGMYQCRATNELKTKYSSAQLRVLSLKPSFKKHPLEPETYAADRGNVTLVCNPEAAPRPQFVWKLNGNVIGSGGRRTILDNGNLIINPVTREDEGTYICTASNDYGVDETRGRLIVLRAPVFVEHLPREIHSAIMSNHSLYCEAETEFILDKAYKWKHNGKEIRDKDLIDNPRLHKYDGQFEIINITLADAGDWECVVTSSVGETMSATKLIVDGPPGPPGGLEVLDIIKTTVILEWIDGAQNGRPITMYTVSAKVDWNLQWFDLVQNITIQPENFISSYTDRKRIQLDNVLNPYTSYQFRIRAANDLGYGPPSLPSSKHKTPSDKPLRAPTRVGGGGGKMGELTITWDPLPPAYINGPNIHYKIYWRRKGHDEEFQSRSLRKYGNVGKSIVQIADEYYYTQYDVKVQAINDVGEGPISKAVTIFSAEQIPFIPPQNVRASSYNSTSLNVTWDPVPEDREMIRGKLIGHRIKYWPSDKQEEEAVYFLSRTTRPWSLIVGLQPDTNYWVKVMAYNGAGPGPESERFRERTYRKAPQSPPSSVSVWDVNPSTVRVEWRYLQLNSDEEAIMGFKIRVWEYEQDMATANDTIVPAGSKLEGYVTNLTPGKTYNLRVLAFSIAGQGRMSSPPMRFQMGEWSRSSAGNKILDASLGVCIILFLRQFGYI